MSWFEKVPSKLFARWGLLAQRAAAFQIGANGRPGQPPLPMLPHLSRSGR